MSKLPDEAFREHHRNNLMKQEIESLFFQKNLQGSFMTIENGLATFY